ncbi:HNH endonuclease [Rathayibacter sp. AY1E2]|uniref:HNH endonuclease n=1 Tax=Rathayibacter sp. AY1E2 TaxID=2080550 RepID=UPI001C67D0A0|nr:HNH endonuclease signature motif containing protein [Rathayibacter sp. AY1E2]
MIWIAFLLWEGSAVARSSDAVGRLLALNEQSKERLRALPPLTIRRTQEFGTKRSYDSADLLALLRQVLLEDEKAIEQEINRRLIPLQSYAVYDREFVALMSFSVGRSSHRRIRPDRFVHIERKIAERRRLPVPVAQADVSFIARYTSPRGRNSYARRLPLSFDQLRYQLNEARRARAELGTVAAARKRERGLMTASMRLSILVRDGSRCQICGISAEHGATLHIDHIHPVSLGGRTEPSNLQTLCDSCNLAKGARVLPR